MRWLTTIRRAAATRSAGRTWRRFWTRGSRSSRRSTCSTSASSRMRWSASPGSAPHAACRALSCEADEIEVVDTPADTRELAELRELALLVAADVVDHQLQDYLDSHGVEARWGTQERILVCLTARSDAEKMLRSGQRNARRFHGALLAVYLEQPGLKAEDKARLSQHLAL